MKKLLLGMFIVLPVFLAGCGEDKVEVVAQPTEEQLEKRDNMTKKTEDTPSKSY